MTNTEDVRDPRSTVVELKGGIANLIISLLNATTATGRSRDEAVSDVVEWLETSVIEPMKITGE
jgi:hypothetical protein